MAGGRTTEDLADLRKRDEGEREINARRLVYRQQSRAKSRGAHPREHCLFMRVSLFSPRERGGGGQRGRGRTSWAPSDTMSRPIDFIYLKVTLRRAFLSQIPLLLCYLRFAEWIVARVDHWIEERGRKARVSLREIRMNENAFVDLPLAISRQILSPSLDFVWFLYFLGIFRGIVLLKIFFLARLHLILLRCVIWMRYNLFVLWILAKRKKYWMAIKLFTDFAVSRQRGFAGERWWRSSAAKYLN